MIIASTTRRPLALSVSSARAVIAGDPGAASAERVVAAPGTPTPDRLQMDSAGAAVRAVAADPATVAVVPGDAVGPIVQSVRVGGVDPLTRPRRYPIRTVAPQRQAPRQGPVVRMSVVGDIMLGRGVADAAAAAGGDPSLALRPMQRRLAAADITVGNLENTLSRAGAPTQGGDSFAAPPAVVGGLRDAGFDVLSLANNHLGDFGDRALVETVRRLRAGGFDTFGAGGNPATAWQPAVVERAGVSFGFLGFNAIGETPKVRRGQPGAVSVSMPPRTGPLNRAELDRFLGAVGRLEAEVDVVVALPHWGTQYTNVPDPIQRRVAGRLVSAGVDLVVGGHPHWVQGTEMVDGRLVVHSLGNFVFDMDFMEETQKGLLLELTFWGDDLKKADFVPYAMDENFAPRVQSFSEGIDTLRLMWATSATPMPVARSGRAGVG
ncbi:MAG TPA: CapA family protein [Nocardioidaceae bacterium]|nr:CapA family protein [Nocardioidaceae bacterium]